MTFLFWFGLGVFSAKPPTGKTNLKEDNNGTDEYADALEKISYHMDKGCSHTSIGLLSPVSWKNIDYWYSPRQIDRR